MRAFGKQPKKHSHLRTAPTLSEVLLLLLNSMLCLVGIVLGFLYLFEGRQTGWLFVASFIFFLLVQFADRTDGNG